MQFHLREIYLHVVEAEHLYLVGSLIQTAHCRPYSGQQFTRAERLGDIIVGPQLQQQNLIQNIAGRTQHQDWNIRGFLFDFATNVLTRFSRQTQVQNDQSRSIGAKSLHRHRSIGSYRHIESRRLKGPPQSPLYCRVVFDD